MVEALDAVELDQRGALDLDGLDTVELRASGPAPAPAARALDLDGLI